MPSQGTPGGYHLWQPPIHQGMGFCLQLDQAIMLNLDLEVLNDSDGVEFKLSAITLSQLGQTLKERAGVLNL
jgi:hypothetical protein